MLKAQEENTKLTKLKEENTKLTKLKEANTKLNRERNDLAREKDKLASQNADLTKKIKL